MMNGVYLFRVYDNDDYSGNYKRETAFIATDTTEGYSIKFSSPNSTDSYKVKKVLTPMDLHAEVLAVYYKKTGKHGMPEV